MNLSPQQRAYFKTLLSMDYESSENDVIFGLATYAYNNRRAIKRYLQETNRPSFKRKFELLIKIYNEYVN